MSTYTAIDNTTGEIAWQGEADNPIDASKNGRTGYFAYKYEEVDYDLEDNEHGYYVYEVPRLCKSAKEAMSFPLAGIVSARIDD